MRTYTSKEIKKRLGYSEKTSIVDIKCWNPGKIEKICRNAWIVINEPSPKFSDLALGARFTYPEGSTVWVKVSPTRIAQWVECFKCSGWLGQTIASFDSNGDTSLPVNIL